MSQEVIQSADAPKPDPEKTDAPAAEAPPVIDTVPGVDPVGAAVEAAQRLDTEPMHGGYTGVRASQEAGARYEPGMPIPADRLANPQDGDPQIPHLGPGDPRT